VVDFEIHAEVALYVVAVAARRK
jgi:hypothetical protein